MSLILLGYVAILEIFQFMLFVPVVLSYIAVQVSHIRK